MKFAALAALLLAVPAAAQDRAAEIDFQNASVLTAAAKKSAAVERALVAMNDGPEAGGKVVAYLRERGIKVSVETQAEAVKTVTSAKGVVTIQISDAIPDTNRVYGALIAKEIAPLMFADMPACSERAYMRRGTVGRVWLELYGVLPGDLAKDNVSAISDEITLWADQDGAEMALYKIGLAENLISIPELEDSAKDEAAKKKLREANARFVAFLMDEAPVRKESVPRRPATKGPAPTKGANRRDR